MTPLSKVQYGVSNVHIMVEVAGIIICAHGINVADILTIIIRNLKLNTQINIRI